MNESLVHQLPRAKREAHKESGQPITSIEARGLERESGQPITSSEARGLERNSGQTISSSVVNTKRVVGSHFEFITLNLDIQKCILTRERVRHEHQ